MASTDVDQELNLEALADDLQGTKYDPGQFPGLVYRSDEPKSAALIFRSGAVVITGATSEAAVHEAFANLFDTFDDLGIAVPNPSVVSVVNFVCSASLGRGLNLNAVAIGLGLENVEYEPEQFPGLVYRPDEPNVVALLFGSGKLVITGAKRMADVEGR